VYVVKRLWLYVYAMQNSNHGGTNTLIKQGINLQLCWLKQACKPQPTGNRTTHIAEQEQQPAQL
jgi:hypothetical protein